MDNGALQSEISADPDNQYLIEPVSSDLVIVRPLTALGTNSGEQLVKLHGITSEGVLEFSRQTGANKIQQLTGGVGYFVSAGKECEAVLPGGGRGVFGQVFSLDGRNINEELIQAAHAKPDLDDPCGGDALAQCYASLPVTEPLSGFTVSRFLWKPVSESDGNLVILVDAFNVTVNVEGGGRSETLRDAGASNGYGTTARANAPGCAYGRATVTFRDLNGLKVKLANGDDSVQVDGCSRTEKTF